MYRNELLEEIWAIKDELAREADYDIRKHCDRLSRFSQEIPREPEALRRYLQDAKPVIVREDPPDYPPNHE